MSKCLALMPAAERRSGCAGRQRSSAEGRTTHPRNTGMLHTYHTYVCLFKRMSITLCQAPCSDCAIWLQMRHAREAATALKELVQRLHVALCVTHGNGPQVGLLALQVGHSARLLHMPKDKVMDCAFSASQRITSSCMSPEYLQRHGLRASWR